MAKKLISFNFNGEFIPELGSLSKSYPISEVNTDYCTTALSRIKELKTDTYLAEAIANYAGTIDTMHLFVGRTLKNEYIAEYQKPGKDEIQICIGTVSGGSFVFKSGRISEETGLLYPYEDGHKGTMFVMAMLPKITEDREASLCMDNIYGYSVEDENYSKAMCRLSNNIYYRLKDGKSTAPVPYQQEPKILSQADIDNAEVERIFCGEPKVFSRPAAIPLDDYDEEEAELSVPHVSEIRNMYLLNEDRVLTDEEEKRVPNLGEWYVVPEWSKKTAKRIAASRKFRKSIGNILLYGPSGTGKTEGSQAIAEMLGLPYYTITCSADDDKFDLIGQLIPNTEKGKSGMDPEEACKELGIPTFDDVENDFSVSFEKLFGKMPGKLDTEADAFREITRRLLEKESGDTNDFKYVESELIQAIKNGGFCEIQEANIIKRSSVMEALNPLLANGGNNSFIKLPTGEIIRRHPDCIIAFTINRDYEGCNDLQEAVYSRINYIKQVPEPTETELFERTKAQTGFYNDALLKRMAKTIADIHEYCREKDITGGVCGPRELIDWAEVAILESEEREEVAISETSVIDAALDTILEKVAQNEDDIEDIIAGVFNKQFLPAILVSLRGRK